jgi:hypothetical protein
MAMSGQVLMGKAAKGKGMDITGSSHLAQGHAQHALGRQWQWRGMASVTCTEANCILTVT